MISFEVKLDTSGFDRLIEQLEAATEEAAVAMAEDAFEESQRLVPVDTGELKQSGRVEARGDEAAVVYGGPQAPHAAVVELKPGVKYRRGQSGYVRSSVMRKRPMLEAAAKPFKKLLGG